jgi:phosphate starvation-inducible protein PhoH
MSYLPFEALHPEQHDALDCLEGSAIAFLLGPAGTSKSHCAMHHAISLAIDQDSKIHKIYLARPAVPMGRDIGFLPGTASEKLEAFLFPLANIRKKILAHDAKLAQKVERMIEILPLSHARGLTIENSVAIIDEAQNCTGEEILAICTRIGRGGKIIFCGDVAQSDLKYSPLREAAIDLDGLSRKGMKISQFEFSIDACVRHPLVGAILNKTEGARWLE